MSNNIKNKQRSWSYKIKYVFMANKYNNNKKLFNTKENKSHNFKINFKKSIARSMKSVNKNLITFKIN